MLNDGPEHRDATRAAELTKLGEFAMTSERENGVHTICLFGELDLATAAQLERELARVEASDAPSIVLDLSGLTFISSTGISLLLRAHGRSRADTGRLRMLRGPASVQRVLELSAVDDLLPFVG